MCMTGQRPSVSCPRTRASRATGQKQPKHWIPAFAGMTVSAGVQRALMKRPPRASYNVRITELGPRGLPWRLERPLYDAQNPNSVFQIGFLTHEARRACRKDPRHQAREGMDLETHHR